MAGWRFYLNDIEVEEPIGWDGIQFEAIRMESHGIDQPFSTEVSFYGNGAKLIKALYDVFFINAEITIRIVSNQKVNGELYVFNGFLNLSVYSEINVCDTDSWTISVGIIEDNFRQNFKARQDVEIDLTQSIDLNNEGIDPIDFRNIRLHCQDLFLVGKAKNLAVGEGSIYPVDILGAFISAPYQLPFYFDNSDFNGVFGNTFDPTGVGGSETNVLLVNNADYTRTFQWKGDVDMDAFYIFASPTSLSAIYVVTLVIYDTSLPSPFVLSTTTLATSTLIPYNTGANLTFSFDETVVLAPNQRATIQARWLLPSPILDAALNRIDLTVNNCCLTITELNSSLYASNLQCLTVEEALRRAIYQLTGDPDGLISDCFSEDLEGCYWNNILTTGQYIRNAATVNQIIDGCGNVEEGSFPIFKTSFKKMFEGLDRIFCLGWDFQKDNLGFWKIRVEPREYFYQNEIVQTNLNVDNVKQYAITDKLVNQLELGYSDKWKNISISGAFAIHTDRNYFIKNRAMTEGSTAKFENLSDIICEGYAIEFSRRLQFIKEDSGSSDRPNDYELFLIWINRNEMEFTIDNSGYQFPEETGTIAFSAGTISMSSQFITESNSPIQRAYNILHTPARVALRWWKVLGMHTYGLVDPIMQFRAGQYNITYSSIIDSSIEPDACMEPLTDDPYQPLYENTDIYPDLMKEQFREYLFRPIGIDFEYPQTLCEFLLLSETNQYGMVQMQSGNLTLNGFIESAKNEPVSDSGGVTVFKLLLANKTPIQSDYNQEDYLPGDYA